MRIKLCYNTSTEQFEIIDEGTDQGVVHKQEKIGDKIYFVVTAREGEGVGSLHIDPDGEL